MSDWLDFWSRTQRVYVNDRHREAHFRKVATDVLAVLDDPSIRVLDYGAGEALHADRIAAAAGHVILCELADGVRRRLAARFADHPGISVVGDVSGLEPGSVGLMVVNSVLQYLSDAELDRLLADAARLLPAGGRLLVGDVVPVRTSLAGDVAALLRYGARHGFLLAAVVSLCATAMSPYTKVRRRLGLSRHDEAGLVARLAAAGFTAHRHLPNLSHNPNRMSFMAIRDPATRKTQEAAAA
ncbi:class I SAM-dependent methyltransferase [Amycolatopsis suaedae]|uniref:Class I SAM-dependent methyltransferase n=1 Tax=Amycolatopsis suaedae TaxID=2510978 RepID=A0A4Q7J3C7_9PSEU|nr:class I SAM-dependent methyltransferase [Amycolatopsis suaedae]RZQ61122.1 class I SAM-dependent methyltransferase [Amycolatopsis suaedae]